VSGTVSVVLRPSSARSGQNVLNPSTSTTRVNIHSVQQNGKVEIIANDQGNRITPSWVAFTPEERLVGDAAKNQAPQNPENTVFDAKRLVGRQFSEGDVQRDIKHWPFKIKNKGGKPMIEVKHQNALKEFVSWFAVDPDGSVCVLRLSADTTAAMPY
jgi:hypothetical protein